MIDETVAAVLAFEQHELTKKHSVISEKEYAIKKINKQIGFDRGKTATVPPNHGH